MPSGEIKVDYNTIHTAAEDCNTTTKELERLFGDLKNDLNPLINTWDGNAKESYLNAQKQWDDKFDDLKQVLAQIAIVLPQIADGYQGTESGVEQLF
jgi:early secretory antigenic target protein ESAT-6